MRALITRSTSNTSKVYNLMVPALIATVDKLDLSTEPDIEDEEDGVAGEIEMETLSDTQVAVLRCALMISFFYQGDSISESNSRLYCVHLRSVGSEAESL